MLSPCGRSDCPDHPHAGGENVDPECRYRRFYGPSPRGWGERSASDRMRDQTRTIPTGVGRTEAQHLSGTANADHPHAGGENRDCRACVERIYGPSPRGWGEPPGRQSDDQAHRTIPTRVGRTIPRRTRGRGTSDHPHAGGENIVLDESSILKSGPSPRGWGELAPKPGRFLPSRTIPTRVGRTGTRAPSNRTRTDHPHAGGENVEGPEPVASEIGPSPRGWGELSGVLVVVWLWRTIPTRVGRTITPGNQCDPAPDHPHAGGENSGSASKLRATIGPSPRGWGEQTS